MTPAGPNKMIDPTELFLASVNPELRLFMKCSAGRTHGGNTIGRHKSPQKFGLNCEDKLTFYWCLEKKIVFEGAKNFSLREFRNKAICTYRLKAFSTSFFPLGQVSAINFDSDFF